MLLPFAALLINLSLALKNHLVPCVQFCNSGDLQYCTSGTQAGVTTRRALLWTAGLPLLGLVGFVVHLAIFVMPLGAEAYGPGVPIGWPPRFLFLSYMVWLITLALQAIKLRSQKAQQA